MNQAIVTAFAILLVMGAVVQKGDSYIRAGREMVYDNQGRPVQFAEEYYDRPGRSSRPFKKGKKILQGGGRDGWREEGMYHNYLYFISLTRRNVSSRLVDLLIN